MMVNMSSFDFVNKVSFAPASVGLDADGFDLKRLESDGETPPGREHLENGARLEPG
jgi:hypothetical protein